MQEKLFKIICQYNALPLTTVNFGLFTFKNLKRTHLDKKRYIIYYTYANIYLCLLLFSCTEYSVNLMA